MQTQTQPEDLNHSVDAAEVEQFSRIAEEWWDPAGKFKPLHQINPVRLGYMKQHICQHFGRDVQASAPMEGLRLIDIGCGGGLISEPMCRMGATVTGIDASERNIKTARLHASQMGLAIDYQAITAEALATTQPHHFDVVLALEIIEHVVDPQSFIDSCCQLLCPGGLLIMSTINRTPQAYVKAIIGAEYVLRLLPKGTHQWQKFVRPSEMQQGFIRNGLHHVHSTGMVLNPLRWEFVLDERNLGVNYLMVGAAPASL